MLTPVFNDLIPVRHDCFEELYRVIPSLDKDHLYDAVGGEALYNLHGFLYTVFIARRILLKELSKC